jgi:hypothetical protein
LSRHKILIETFVGLVLVSASTFISYLQWRTAQLQTTVAIRQSEPTFSISAHLRMPEGESRYTEQDLMVSNVGGIALETRTKVTTWIFVSLIGQNKPSKQTLVIPVNGYFSGNAVHGGSVTGLLEQYTGYRNHQTWIDLERGARELANKKGFYLEMRLRTYAVVFYSDIFGKRQSRYYEVDSISGSIQINQTEGGHYIDDALSSPTLVELDKITPEQIFELAIKSPQK